MQKVITNFHCNLCKKYYSSYQSLWIHNKKFHTNNVVSNVVPVISNVVSNVVPISLETKKYNCKLCNKEFNNRCNKWRHEQLCKKKNNTIDNNLNNELIELKNKNTELENSLKEIKELLINSKIHHKTLQKINKQLNTTNNTTNNITNNNNNITINNTINLVSLGSENLSEVLNKKEKLNILRDMYGSLSKIVQYVHFNDKFPQFKTMLITNMQNNIAYKYDEDENRFITISKDELLNDLISIRLDDIIAFNEEVGEKLDINSKKKIETFLDTIDNNEKFFYNLNKKLYFLFKLTN